MSALLEDLDEVRSDPAGGSGDGNLLAAVFGLHRSSFLFAGGSTPAELIGNSFDTRRREDVTDGQMVALRRLGAPIMRPAGLPPSIQRDSQAAASAASMMASLHFSGTLSASKHFFKPTHAGITETSSCGALSSGQLRRKKAIVGTVTGYFRMVESLERG